MASPSLKPLQRPVRILIRTRPAQLQEIHPLLDQADTKLIEKLCMPLLGSSDAAEIRHLITKTSARNGSERVEIVFDYGVPANECQPQVAAFNVKVDGSNLTVTRLFNPTIKPEVNRRVELWRKMNLTYDISFPSRTDVRQKRRTPNGVPPVSVFMFNVMRSLGANIPNRLSYPRHELGISV